MAVLINLGTGAGSTNGDTLYEAFVKINTNYSDLESTSNKSINVTTDGASDTKYPSVKAVKTYVDANAGGTQVTKSVKVTITPLQVQSLFTTPIKVIQGVSGKAIMPIQILVLSNNQVAGYSPSGGQLQLKHEGSSTVILSSNTGLGSFGDAEGYGLSASSITRGGFTTNGVSVFSNMSTANPVGGDGGLILHIVYNEITF
jgi:hypothetical protein